MRPSHVPVCRWPSVAALVVFLAMLPAADEVAVLAWDDLAGADTPAVRLSEQGIMITSAGAGTYPLATWELPPEAGDRYRLQGQVRYQDLAPGSYIEVWNRLPDGRAFFTRTLADAGPMQALGGSSDWRPVLLPADASDADQPVTELQINLVTQGPGTVEISDLRLVRLGPDEALGAGEAHVQALLDRSWFLILVSVGIAIGALLLVAVVLVVLALRRRPSTSGTP